MLVLQGGKPNISIPPARAALEKRVASGRFGPLGRLNGKWSSK
jgi:hypothetical protein